MAALPGCLRLQQHRGTLGRQQSANLLYALETLRVLLAGGSGVVLQGGCGVALQGGPDVDSEAAANAEAMLKGGIDDILIGAPLGDHAISSAAVRTQVPCFWLPRAFGPLRACGPYLRIVFRVFDLLRSCA